MEQIETHYIFLDTSIFIKENFFLGNKLKAFLKHSENSEIRILTTRITIEEVLSNIEKSSLEAYTVLKKSLREIDSKSKIFKNVESLNALFSLDQKFDFEAEKTKLKKRFSKIAKGFTLVEIDNNVTTKIIADYFSNNPPFKDGRKKNEFPDAYVLNSLESWCKKFREKVYVITDDSDLLTYKSKYLIPIQEYEKLLTQISYTYSVDNMIPKVENVIQELKDEIVGRVEMEFIEYFPDRGIDYNLGLDYEVQDVEMLEIAIDSYSVLYFSENTATVELTMTADFAVGVAFEDKSSAWYDKEEDDWYGVEIKTDRVYDTSELKVLAKILIDLPGKPVYYNSLDFIEISSGLPTEIGI